MIGQVTKLGVEDTDTMPTRTLFDFLENVSYEVPVYAENVESEEGADHRYKVSAVRLFTDRFGGTEVVIQLRRAT